MENKLYGTEDIMENLYNHPEPKRLIPYAFNTLNICESIKDFKYLKK